MRVAGAEKARSERLHDLVDLVLNGVGKTPPRAEIDPMALAAAIFSALRRIRSSQSSAFTASVKYNSLTNAKSGTSQSVVRYHGPSTWTCSRPPSCAIVTSSGRN